VAVIEVPPLPVAHVQAFRLLRELEPSVQELVGIVENDPSLTASLLRVANSARSFPVARIGTVRGAIVRIGVTDARRMVLAATLGEAFSGENGSGVDEHELWRHLTTTAVLAEMLLPDAADGSEAFTAGLLHDIGRLVMASQAPSRYGKVVELAGLGLDVIEAERRTFGLTHVDWGERIGRQWDFPEPLVAAIAGHHECAAGDLARAVHGARRMAYELGIGNGVSPAPEPPGPVEVPPVVASYGGVEAVSRQVEWFSAVIRWAA
jgi:putative nucleotidyltransferase with HDIG domain